MNTITFDDNIVVMKLKDFKNASDSRNRFYKCWRAKIKECENLQSKIDKAIEYLTSYEAISTIQGLDSIEKNKELDENTMNIMTNRYLEVHHKLLDILKENK